MRIENIKVKEIQEAKTTTLKTLKIIVERELKYRESTGIKL